MSLGERNVTVKVCVGIAKDTDPFPRV
jgi:hypothetical protein